MSDGLLVFPDAPRVALDLRIAELVEAAEQVIGTQERLRDLVRAHQSIAAEHEFLPALQRIARTAVLLAAAGSGALVLRGSSGDVERIVHADPAPTPLHSGPRPDGAAATAPRLDDGGPWPTTAGPVSSTCTVLQVPIRVHGVHYGEILLGDSLRGGFSVEDEQLVQSIAVTAGFAIESARLYDEMRRGRAWAVAAADIAARLLGPDSGEEVALVADRVLELADAARACVALFTADGGSMSVWHLGVDRADVPTEVVAATGTLVERICAGDGPLRIDAAAADDGAGLTSDGPVLGLPMLVGGRRLGALVLSRVRGAPPFSDTDTAMAEGFVARASVAMQLRRHYADREHGRPSAPGSRLAEGASSAPA